ncbi:hypothetical protein [Hoeflea sp.]|uniref:hypothetical protein n=1 Tax=Hoeflea sp. TaxID=1940281 RepID=UPI003A8DA3BE
MPESTKLHFQPLQLPSGTVLTNRIAKSAMSDSLGDGCGNPTDAQMPDIDTAMRAYEARDRIRAGLWNHRFLG